MANTSNNLRSEIHAYLCKHESMPPDSELTIADIFYDPSKRSKSVRLTRVGAKLMSKYFDHKTFTFDKSIVLNFNILVKLARTVTAPYQINTSLNTITLFGGDDIVMFTLVDDFETWIDTL